MHADTRYTPGRTYTVAELGRFATINQPSLVNRSAFIRHLLSTFERPDVTRAEKATLCKHLANFMNSDEAFEFKGAPRQANYFASYCVDLTLQELDLQFNAAMEQDLRSMLTLWSHELCPSQTEFNLDGIIYSRPELQNMLNGQKLISRNLLQASGSLAERMDNRLHGVGTSSQAQTVHDMAVRDNGARVLALMKTAHAQTTQLSDSEIKTFIEKAISQNTKTKLNTEQIRQGLQACLTNHAGDNNWNVHSSPRLILGDVCQYIQATANTTMRNNLQQALLDRLIEIAIEQPCTPGVMQRLLDVPNGIDPNMNFAGKSRQIGEEMASLASKTYERLTVLIDEGRQAIPESERTPETMDQMATTIGQQMFVNRVNHEMKRLGGMSEMEVAPHRERLSTGF